MLSHPLPQQRLPSIPGGARCWTRHFGFSGQAKRFSDQHHHRTRLMPPPPPSFFLDMHDRPQAALAALYTASWRFLHVHLSTFSSPSPPRSLLPTFHTPLHSALMGTAFSSPVVSPSSSSSSASSSSSSSSPPTTRHPTRLPRHNPSWAFQTAVSQTLQRRGYVEALWDALVSGNEASHRPPIPCEVLPLILHYAASFKEVTLSKEEHIQVSNGDYPYLTHPIPLQLHGHEVVGARISVTSHDQGWSDHHHLKGTYVGAYTWGEAVVVESGAPTSVTEGGAQRVVLAKEVYRNLHAVKTWQTHEKSFVAPKYFTEGGGGGGGAGVEEESKEEGVQWDGGDVVAALMPGRALTLQLHAMYPGWINYTKQAQITVQYLKVV